MDELQDLGLFLREAEKQAQEWINEQVALHNPDQVAGGYASNIGGVGDNAINSSIGSQWRYRIDAVDEQIKIKIVSLVVLGTVYTNRLICKYERFYNAIKQKQQVI